MNILEINELSCSIDKKEVLKKLKLSIKAGEIHVIMGPNGAGKSTLAKTIMAHPACSITSGELLYKGESIKDLDAHEVSKKGIFLLFQHPRSIQGISFSSYLYEIYKNKILTDKQLDIKEARKDKELRKKLSPLKYRKELLNELKSLSLEEEFTSRELNCGFSGGEKKKSEIMQLDILKPDLAILDELDSGLDVDAIKICSQKINKHVSERNMALIIITHSTKILENFKADFVHLFKDGKIAESGDSHLAQKIEANGFLD